MHALSQEFTTLFHIQFLSLHISFLFSILLHENIVDIGKPDGICLLTFVVDEFSELISHPSIFFIILHDLHKQ